MANTDTDHAMSDETFAQLYPSEPSDDEIRAAREKIDHGCDGPITPFVLIARACDLASGSERERSAVANALHGALVSYGWLSDGDDDKIVTGS